MTSTGRDTGDGAAAAQRIVDGVTSRAALHEAVGIVLAWHGGDQGHALEEFCGQRVEADREAEVARLKAVVDAEARNREDPDWHGRLER